MRALVLLGLCLALLTKETAYAQSGSLPIQASDVYTIHELGNLTASPDGRWVAYTVRSAYQEQVRGEERVGYRTQIWMAPADGSSEPRPLTSSAANASQPTWHPDSRHLAFVRAVEGAPQIYVLSLEGGEAVQWTNVPTGASQPTFSPNGQRLLFATSLAEADVRRQLGRWPAWHERPARSVADTVAVRANPDGSLAEIRAWLDQREGRANPRVLNRLNFQGEFDLQPELSFRHWHVMEARPKATSRPLTSGFSSWPEALWLSNTELLLSTRRDTTLHPDRDASGMLVRMNLTSGQSRVWATSDTMRLGGPVLSPDGRFVAISGSPLSDPGYVLSQAGVISVEGGEIQWLTTSLDRSVSDVAWTPASDALLFTAPANGGFPLYRASLQTPSRIERLTPRDEGVRSFVPVGEQVLWVRTTWQNPFELVSQSLRDGQVQVRSAHNAGWLAERRVSPMVADSVLMPEGHWVAYWTIPPANVTPGQRYPLMLQIHGGPMAMWGPGEASMWHEFQLFASRGFGIVLSNPRGSGGYGYAFQRANYQDWGHGPSRDVLAAATRAAQLPWADPARQVVTGGSYAGYLTTFIIGHDHRFKAAFAQRGVYDLRTFFGEGNAFRLVPNHFGGYPWQTDSTFVQDYWRIGADGPSRETLTIAQLLDRESPLSYVHQMRTPLLIKHGDADLRTGVIQSEMLFRSLSSLGKPVEYVRYPRAGHDLSRSGEPDQRVDRLLRILEFMERYVR